MAEPLPALDPDIVSGDGGASATGGAPTGDAPYPTRPDVAADYAAASTHTRERLWWAAGTLYRRRRWIAAITLAVAGAAVYLTLQIPNSYRAETRVLLPDGGGGDLLSGALSNLPPAAAALVTGGSGGGGFERYMAILTSRSTMESVVERFDLVRSYDVADEHDPTVSAVRELRERVAFDVSLDFDYLAVTVLDEDPQRAAQMADFFVERLNERHVEFQSSSAADNRAFLRTRLDQANADLDRAQAQLQAVQERSGVVEPGAQAEALFSALAAAQAEVSAAEVQYQALVSELGPENTISVAARAGLEAARGQLSRLRAGSEQGLPALRELPRVQRDYTSAMQDLVMQQAIIEAVQPLYEQAALEEQRETDAVQVLDPAVPPTRKAEPHRSLIVIAATLSAFLVAVAVVLTLAVLRRAGPPFLARLRAG